MRKSIHFTISNITEFRCQCISWAEEFEYFALLDSNNSTIENSNPIIPSTYDMIIGAGSISVLYPKSRLTDLKSFNNSVSDWTFGHLSFNLQSETEEIISSETDNSGFGNIFFFQPKWVITLKDAKAELLYPETISETDANIELLKILKPVASDLKNENNLKIKCRSTKGQYINIVNQLQSHIAKGDIYEINYCIEFFSTDCEINPYITYLALQEYSPAPFSAFYKFKNSFLLSSSPERYLKKAGKRIFSQPIKGTIARGENKVEDATKRNELVNNEKERSENIMIADLVRNDLSRVAVPGSVKVEELCGIYTFKYVHQLISTISAELALYKNPEDALYFTFPMGSMTGAPKHAALKLINEYEFFNRGLFSGSVGYFSPSGDFDFNVVIRSILYNQSNKYLSIPAGSAITASSDPEKEYEECLLKANALIQVLK